MVEISKIYSDEQAQKFHSNPIIETKDEDVSIFTSVNNSEVDSLTSQLESVKEDNGFVLKAWDGFKNAVNLGVSSEDCDEAIQKFKNGEISYEEAEAKINEYSNKQESSLNLFSNIATGIAGVVAATAAAAAIVASGGTASIPILAAVGAGAGALTKPVFKASDRATNDKKGDTLNAKQLAKDTLSGAITGGIGAATMGTGSASSSLATSVGKSALKSARTGLITGTVSGSSNYLIDTTFDEDKKFNTKEFLATTATSAVVGGAVGGIMGSANGAMKYSGVLKHGGMVVDDAGKKLVHDSAADLAANAACNAEYKLVNNAIRQAVA